MRLEGKKIIIFSPQPWYHINVSKHHYALELSKKNRVYFFTAPSKFGVSSNCFPVNELLSVYEYQIPFPRFLRFKLYGLYVRITAFILQNIIAQKIGSVDLCIDFGCDRFLQNLDFISSQKKIYFRVDDSPDFKPKLRGADLLLSVSRNIVEKYALQGIKCNYMNHGLAEQFVFQEQYPPKNNSSGGLNAGYAGNILIPHIDRESIIRTIVENSSVTFHFFGVDKDAKMTDNQRQWIISLKSQPNVILHGALNTEKLILNFQKIDVFLLCYKTDRNAYHSDNSHKILEYLSTGKVIVSSWIQHYCNLDLFPMCNQNDNKNYSNLFQSVVHNLSVYNNENCRRKRREYAMNNSYKNQIQVISALLNNKQDLK
jgi:hypothetical protein